MIDWKGRNAILLILQIIPIYILMLSPAFMSVPIVVTIIVLNIISAVISSSARNVSYLISIVLCLDLWVISDIVIILLEKPAGNYDQAIRLIACGAIILVSMVSTLNFHDSVNTKVKTWKNTHLGTGFASKKSVMIASIVILIFAMQITLHHIRNKAWTDSLVSAAKSADVIFAGGMTSKRFAKERIHGNENVINFIEQIEVNDSWSKPLIPCLCYGDYQIHISSGKKRIIELHVHGNSIRWYAGKWEKDARLTKKTSNLLESTFRPLDEKIRNGFSRKKQN